MGAELRVYESSPPAAYRVVGWLQTQVDPMWYYYPLEEHLRVVRAEGRMRGCDALIWNPNHLLMPGVVSNDETGFWREEVQGLHRSGPQVSGVRAACIACELSAMMMSGVVATSASASSG